MTCCVRFSEQKLSCHIQFSEDFSSICSSRTPKSPKLMQNVSQFVFFKPLTLFFFLICEAQKYCRDCTLRSWRGWLSTNSKYPQWRDRNTTGLVKHNICPCKWSCCAAYLTALIPMSSISHFSFYVLHYKEQVNEVSLNKSLQEQQISHVPQKNLKHHARSRDINSNTKSSSFALVFFSVQMTLSHRCPPSPGRCFECITLICAHDRWPETEANQL